MLLFKLTISICFSCPLTNNIIDAIQKLKKKFQVKSLTIQWRPRCEDFFAEMADQLSKRGWEAVEEYAAQYTLEMGYQSTAVADYVSNLVQDPLLGERIISSFMSEAESAYATQDSTYCLDEDDLHMLTWYMSGNLTPLYLDLNNLSYNLPNTQSIFDTAVTHSNH